MSTPLEEGSVGFDYDSVEETNERSIEEISDLPMEIQELVKELARQETQDALTKIIALIYDSHNYRLKLAAIVQAFGLPLFHGKTQKEIAEDHGVTKQALSKSIKRFQKEFDLPICSGQKSLEACENYRKSALRRHHDV